MKSVSRVYVSWVATDTDCVEGMVVKWWWVDQSGAAQEAQEQLKGNARSCQVTRLREDTEYTLEVSTIESLPSTDKYNLNLGVGHRQGC